MVSNGLDITEKQFMKMSDDDQRLVLFRHAVHGKKKFADYAFHKKIQYVWLSVLTAVVGIFTGIRGMVN